MGKSKWRQRPFHQQQNVHQLHEQSAIKGMDHVPNIFISFDKYLFLEVINILI